ncbi:hypothetical protein [Frondihabitans australicus]|uniref:hypothetical protein n=1 Tax=Frondihabitans australicus TaxID=386892 RepID=UPI0011C46BD0|nr:hypothetical protein [Frondihabitans australicus]
MNDPHDAETRPAAPVTSAPVTSAPVTSAPVTSAPVTSAPVTSAPVASKPVTSVSLSASRMRRRLAKAAGAHLDPADPGLSPAPEPRDPAEKNGFAIAALAVGIVGAFISGFYVAPVVALVLCLPARRRAIALAADGLRPWGRRRTLWAFWLGVFGVAQYSYALFVVPLFH